MKVKVPWLHLLQHYFLVQYLICSHVSFSGKNLFCVSQKKGSIASSSALQTAKTNTCLLFFHFLGRLEICVKTSDWVTETASVSSVVCFRETLLLWCLYSELRKSAKDRSQLCLYLHIKKPHGFLSLLFSFLFFFSLSATVKKVPADVPLAFMSKAIWLIRGNVSRIQK